MSSCSRWRGRSLTDWCCWGSCPFQTFLSKKNCSEMWTESKYFSQREQQFRWTSEVSFTRNLSPQRRGWSSPIQTSLPGQNPPELWVESILEDVKLVPRWSSSFSTCSLFIISKSGGSRWPRSTSYLGTTGVRCLQTGQNMSDLRTWEIL